METPPRSQPSADEEDENSDDDVLFKFPQRGGEHDPVVASCHYQRVYRNDNNLFEGVGFPTAMLYKYRRQLYVVVVLIVASQTVVQQL